MTTLFTRTLRAATLGLLLSGPMATFAADGALEIETKVPASLSGKLSYASMKYWVEVPGQGNVEIWTDDEAYAALIDLVGTQVSLEGAMVHIPVENEHLFRFKMNADSGLRVHRFRTPQSTYSDVR
ncbi:hypothetical protein [Aeromonas rivipollensis]|uniref:hypothetical protein n=1 Tax=Aeromonas rivipollensis TaxID=948519 RepID=UPI003D21737F